MPTKTKAKTETPRAPTLDEAAERAILDIEEALTAREEKHGAISVLPERNLFDAYRYRADFTPLLAYAHLGALGRERGED